MDGLAGVTAAVAAQINATHNPSIFPLMAPLGQVFLSITAIIIIIKCKH